MTQEPTVPNTLGFTDPLLDDLTNYLVRLRQTIPFPDSRPLHQDPPNAGVRAVLQMLEEVSSSQPGDSARA